jgi:chromodomain-helicase-DNA-binding protein 4
MIAGQPLSLVDRPALGIPPTKKAKCIDPSVTKDGTRAHASTTSREKNSAPRAPFPLDLPRPSPVPNVGPSKRPPSPLGNDEAPNSKKIKSSDTICMVCGKSPHHLVKDCPIVLQGPKA